MVFSVAPKIFMMSPVGNTVESGVDIRLMCVVMQGDPPITFQWMKEDRRVDAVAGVRVYSEELSSSIFFSRTNGTHTGNYTCMASNPLGSTLVTTEILVNGKLTSCIQKY